MITKKRCSVIPVIMWKMLVGFVHNRSTNTPALPLGIVGSKWAYNAATRILAVLILGGILVL
jgi:hypothetical protein